MAAPASSRLVALLEATGLFSPSQIEELGLDDLWPEPGVKVVEWAERLPWAPPSARRFRLTVREDGARVVEEADFAEGAVRHREHACKRGDGDEQQPALAQALGDERGDQGADQHDQRGVKPEIIHGRNPPAS